MDREVLKFLLKDTCIGFKTNILGGEKLEGEGVLDNEESERDSVVYALDDARGISMYRFYFRVWTNKEGYWVKDFSEDVTRRGENGRLLCCFDDKGDARQLLYDLIVNIDEVWEENEESGG